MRSGPGGPGHRRVGSQSIPTIWRAKRFPRSSTASAPPSPRVRSTCSSSPIPTISPGPSICAGADIPHTPLALGYALVPREGRAALYLTSGAIEAALRTRLEPLADLRPRSAFTEDLDGLCRNAARVRLDAATGAAALKDGVEAAGGVADVGADPVTAMKAVKNAAEIAGARAAHHRDGLAVTRFLAWLDRGAAEGVSEIAAVEALEDFRRESGLLRDVSFPTISGSGPNGAIVHYRVTRATDRKARPGELFLIDSGAQYADGTTDITRTVAIGTPTDEMRDRFTRVLKGHIAIARAVFPEGTTGAQIDALARIGLWEAGLDYDHGTGHGVRRLPLGP
jgi:Xaa-Pro aminopeptidase